MRPIIDELFDTWIAEPNPRLWPEYLRDHPQKGHGYYCFQEGLRLGLLLAVEALYPETRT